MLYDYFVQFCVSAVGSDMPPRLASAASGIERGVSSGIQDYSSDPLKYPMTKPMTKVSAKLQVNTR